MNRICPDSIRSIDMEPRHAFKMIENISKFLRAARRWGVAQMDLFQSADLVEKKNIPQVTNTILAVARAVSRSNN